MPMQLILPDILTELRGLSIVATVVGMTIGGLLWLLGWMGHRFWIVLCATVAAGIIGLSSGQAAGMQPFVAGLLLAIAAGMLALALARVVAFLAGGVAALVLIWSFVPAWAQNAPSSSSLPYNAVICFLVGGLVGVVLFREWTMALTSLVGTMLMAYFGLCLADQLGYLDAGEWADRRIVLLNWLVAGGTLLGFLTQFFMERWRIHRGRLIQAQGQIQQAEVDLQQNYQKRSWLGRWRSRAA